MQVMSREEAWKKVNEIFPTDYEKDEAASERAGYDIYRNSTLNYYCRICDLGCRLEVITGKYGENVVNIWIMEEVEAQNEETKKARGYGELLSEKIRTATTDFSKLNDYEKFILDRGWEFKTEELLRTAYDRFWRCSRGIVLTEEEFVIEAGEHYEAEILKDVYSTLAELVKQKRLQAAEVYRYARFKWCLRNPEAIVSYQVDRDKWAVNNCATEISEEKAKVAINAEWGFEVSRIKIIETPYYDATDYQFIRFNCGYMTWLWKNGNLYQVYTD